MSDYWLQHKQTNPKATEAGGMIYALGRDIGRAISGLGRDIGRYDGEGWHKAPRRDWRKVQAVPYTQGGDYSGDDITYSNRQEWEENVGFEGVLWARYVGSHGYQELFVRPVAARLAERDSRERERFYEMVSEETATALRTAVDYLEALESYPSLNDETYEIMGEWTREAWESYGRHDCVRETREFVAEFLGVGPEGVETLEELEVSLEDWLYICGEAEVGGVIRCDGGEGNVTLGSVDQRYALQWLKGESWEYGPRYGIHDSEGFELLCAQVFWEIDMEPELRADMEVAVMAGRLSPSQALERVVSA